MKFKFDLWRLRWCLIGEGLEMVVDRGFKSRFFCFISHVVKSISKLLKLVSQFLNWVFIQSWRRVILCRYEFAYSPWTIGLLIRILFSKICSGGFGLYWKSWCLYWTDVGLDQLYKYILFLNMHNKWMTNYIRYPIDFWNW